MCQPGDLGQTRPDDIAQYGAGADGRQLIDIAHQHQVGAGAQGGQQLPGQQQVHHAGLIHNQHIRFDFILGIGLARVLQQPVHGERLVAGGLRQPLGGPAGG